MVRALPVLLLLFCTACGLAEDDRDEDNKHVYLKFYDKAFETRAATGASRATRLSVSGVCRARSGASRR